MNGHGRRKPYTTIGIRRLRCTRCKRKPSYATWQACANANLYVPMCKACDIELNELALAFFRIPGRARLLREYRAKVEAQP